MRPPWRCSLQNGNVWEKAGVAVSVVYGTMPASAYRAAVGRAGPIEEVGQAAGWRFQCLFAWCVALMPAVVLEQQAGRCCHELFILQCVSTVCVWHAVASVASCQCLGWRGTSSTKEPV